MTRAEALNRKRKLEAQLERLEDQLLSVDVTSATLSTGDGSNSYTNRSVDDIKKKIVYCKREIAKLEGLLAGRPSGGIQTIYAEFNA
jgi:hypothetical protein